MGSTGTPTVLGGAIGPLMAGSKDGVFVVIADIAMSSSYATGGDTVTQPGHGSGTLRGLVILNNFDGTRTYHWDGSKTTPKIKALDAFATEEGAATNLSAVTLTVMFIYEGGL